MTPLKILSSGKPLLEVKVFHFTAINKTKLVCLQGTVSPRAAQENALIWSTMFADHEAKHDAELLYGPQPEHVPQLQPSRPQLHCISQAQLPRKGEAFASCMPD